MYTRCQKCGKRLTDPDLREEIPGQLSLKDLVEGGCTDDNPKTEVPGMQ